MERLRITDIAQMGNLMYKLTLNEDSVVTAVLFYDKAQKLLRWLAQYEEIKIGFINFEQEDCDYNKEYYITLNRDFVLNVKPAMTKSHNYAPIETDVLFLDGEVSWGIASINKKYNEHCLEVELEFKEECEDKSDYYKLDYLKNLIDYIHIIEI